MSCAEFFGLACVVSFPTSPRIFPTSTTTAALAVRRLLPEKPARTVSPQRRVYPAFADTAATPPPVFPHTSCPPSPPNRWFLCAGTVRWDERPSQKRDPYLPVRNPATVSSSLVPTGLACAVRAATSSHSRVGLRVSHWAAQLATGYTLAATRGWRGRVSGTSGRRRRRILRALPTSNALIGPSPAPVGIVRFYCQPSAYLVAAPLSHTSKANHSQTHCIFRPTVLSLSGRLSLIVVRAAAPQNHPYRAQTSIVCFPEPSACSSGNCLLRHNVGTSPNTSELCRIRASAEGAVALLGDGHHTAEKGYLP